MEAARRLGQGGRGAVRLLAWLLACLRGASAYAGHRVNIDEFAREWSMAGTAIPAPTSLVLTPGVPGRAGYIWRLRPVPSNDFELQLTFRAKRPEKRSVQNDGFALWYVEENATEALFNLTKHHAHNQDEIIAGTWGYHFLAQEFNLAGYRGKYKGLGVFFSEGDQPSVSAVANDGSKEVKWGTDIPNAEALKFDFAAGTGERGLGSEVKVKVRVQPKEVVVEAEGKGSIKLPASLAAGGYVGISTFGGSLEPKIHEPSEKTMRFEVQELEISNKDPNAKAEEKEVHAVPEAQARKSDEISEDVLRESSSYKDHRAESDAIKDLTNMVFKLVVETQPMRTQMTQAIESLGKRISIMERNFAELKQEIDKKSGHKLSEEFSAIKQELSSLSTVAHTETKERHKKLESLHSDIADVHKSAHSPDQIDKHLDNEFGPRGSRRPRLNGPSCCVFPPEVMANAWHDVIARAIEEEFSVRTMLNISLVKAKGLRPTLKGKIAASVSCQLEGRPYTQLKTEGVLSSNPVWNYTGMIDGCVSGDALELEVWGDNKTSVECLGRAVVPYNLFQPDGFTGEIRLDSETSKKPASVEIKVEVLPVPITTPKELRAFVTFLGAENLTGVAEGSYNPYCVCEIPGKSDSKVRSKICNDTQNPQWNELHEIDDYDVGDNLQLSVISNNGPGKREQVVGTVVMPSSTFQKKGFAGQVQLRQEDVLGTVEINIDIGGPSTDPNRRLGAEDYNPETLRRTARPTQAAAAAAFQLQDDPSRTQRPSMPRRVNAGAEFGVPVMPDHGHPAESVSPEDRQPVPFQLRSLDTNRVHRLCAYTVIGRSKSALDPKYDLILNSPGICDVSRVHAVIKAWAGADGRAWFARIYDDKNDRGYFYDEEGCRLLVGGGTFVDGQPMEHNQGVEISAGSVLRFGVNELWVLESAPLHQRLRTAELACRQAQDAEDPESIRELCVPSTTCDSALKRCGDWISIVRVVLEALQEPDEAPCADCIEVRDECGRPVSRHLASTLEQQEAYDVARILQDVRLGTTLKLRLSSDPCLLAPVLGHLDQVKAQVQETYRSRAQFLG